MNIPCELIFTPGADSRAAHVKLLVSGRTAIDEYEHRLTQPIRDMVFLILKTHSTAVEGFAAKIAVK